MNKKITTFIQSLSVEQKKLRKDILTLSHKAKVSHLGSCFSAVDIISAIYKVKKLSAPFVLSSGHAAVALYAVLNSKTKNKVKLDLETVHIHPDRNMETGIYVSTGSLGQGLPIAVGMALANRKKTVFCLVSDGECSEGSIWEALRVAHEQALNNLVIIINMNGYGAYGAINVPELLKRLKGFTKKLVVVNGHNMLELKNALQQKTFDAPKVIIAKTTVAQLPFLVGQDAHYKVMSDEDYFLVQSLLT